MLTSFALIDAQVADVSQVVFEQSEQLSVYSRRLTYRHLRYSYDVEFAGKVVHAVSSCHSRAFGTEEFSGN